MKSQNVGGNDNYQTTCVHVDRILMSTQQSRAKLIHLTKIKLASFNIFLPALSCHICCDFLHFDNHPVNVCLCGVNSKLFSCIHGNTSFLLHIAGICEYVTLEHQVVLKML